MLHEGTRGVITRRGVELDKDSHKSKDSPGVAALVRRDLVVSPYTLNDPFPKPFKVYVETPTKYIVPLHWARGAGLVLTDTRDAGEAIDVTFHGSLRADLRQPEAVAAAQAAWDEHGGAMMCLPPGYGKTTCALYMVSKLKRKTLVLVHKEFLKTQWADRVAQCLPGARVTAIQGGTCDVSGDVVVAMIQTLLSRKYPADTFRGFGCVVVDEAHHLGAEQMSQVMWGLCCPKTLFLTATPDRKDGLTRVVTWFSGPIAYRLRRENQDSTTVRVVKYACPEFDGPMPTNRRGDVCFVTTITRLVENPARTRAIATLVADLVRDTGRDVLVLSHRRAHCAEIADAVRGLGVECGTYVGGDKTAPATKVIVATYALTSEGFDMPRLTALVLATPASDVEQSCGRVMRGSSAAVIVDVVDQWGLCHAQAAKRRALYVRSGFRIVGGGGDKS